METQYEVYKNVLKSLTSNSFLNIEVDQSTYASMKGMK